MNNLLSIINGFSDNFISIAWAIFWQSSLLALLIATATKIFRKASPNFKYLLWLLVILRLFLPPSFYLPTGVWTWGPALFHKHFIPKTVPPPQYNIPFTISHTDMTINPDVIQPTAFKESLSFNSLLFFAWATGVLALLIFWIKKISWFRKMLSTCRDLPPHLTPLITQNSQRLRLKRRINVKVSDKITTPAVGGFLKPVVIIPSAILDKMDSDELTPIIVHELAHIKRYDWLVNWLQNLTAIIYFFHPFLWFTNRQIKIEREKACDDMVLLTLKIERKSYAETLLRIFDMLSCEHIFHPDFSGMAEPKSDLGRRIMRVMDKKVVPTARLSVVSAILIVIFSLCFLTFSGQPVKELSGATTETLIQANSFDKFYSQLSDDMKQKLQTPINVTCDNVNAEQFLKIISQLIDIPIIGQGLEDKIDVRYKEIPARIVLDVISMERNWVWELSGGNIFVYTDRLLNKHGNLDAFLASLDAGTKEKLETPITLTLKDSNVESFLSELSRQTSLIIISKDIKDRISVEYNKVPAINILKIMAKSGGWKYTKRDGYILFSPAYSETINRIVYETRQPNINLATSSRTLGFTSPSYEQALKQLDELKLKGNSNITIEKKDQEYQVRVTETTPADASKVSDPWSKAIIEQKKDLIGGIIRDERDKTKQLESEQKQLLEKISSKTDTLKNQILLECKILKLSDSVEKSIKDSIEEYVRNKMPIPDDVLKKWLGSKGVELTMMPRLAVIDSDVGTIQIALDHPHKILFSMSITPTAQDDRFILLKKLTTTMLIDNVLNSTTLENIKLERGKTHAIASIPGKNETQVQLLSADFMK